MRRDNRRGTRGNYVESAEAKFSALEAWQPKTNLGKKVKAKEITNIQQIFDSGQKIMEAEIVDSLVPNLETDYINIGQSKGKFGGGKRRIFKQTQKKTMEGNKPHFAVLAVVGNRDGYIGIGLGKSKETMPAREKAVRAAKLNIFQIARGCGSWQCTCGEPHTIPFKVMGEESSVEVKLMPAPKGTGLVIDNELKKVMKLAGIKDIWSKTRGQTRHKINMISACVKALKAGVNTKVLSKHGIKYGAVA